MSYSTLSRGTATKLLEAVQQRLRLNTKGVFREHAKTEGYINDTDALVAADARHRMWLEDGRYEQCFEDWLLNILTQATKARKRKSVAV